MTLTRLIAGAVFMLAAAAAQAFDFKTVGPAPAVLYDAPSQKSTRLYVAPAGMPVQVVTSYGAWAKVRDVNGDLAWTEAKNLSARRAVVVRSADTRVYAEERADATVLMVADKGVVLELVDPEVTAWARVRHRDGITGYVRAADVWGY